MMCAIAANQTQINAHFGVSVFCGDNIFVFCE
jgi:hypothetical protein